jgi:hypothetical protein
MTKVPYVGAHGLSTCARTGWKPVLPVIGRRAGHEGETPPTFEKPGGTGVLTCARAQVENLCHQTFSRLTCRPGNHGRLPPSKARPPYASPGRNLEMRGNCPAIAAAPLFPRLPPAPLSLFIETGPEGRRFSALPPLAEVFRLRQGEIALVRGLIPHIDDAGVLIAIGVIDLAGRPGR